MRARRTRSRSRRRRGRGGGEGGGGAGGKGGAVPRRATATGRRPNVGAGRNAAVLARLFAGSERLFPGRTGRNGGLVDDFFAHFLGGFANGSLIAAGRLGADGFQFAFRARRQRGLRLDRLLARG